MVGYRCSDRTSEGNDDRRCLPRISKLARPGWSACIHQPRGILRSSCRLGRITSEMEETLMVGDMSSHRSWKRVQALLMSSSSPCLNRRIKSLRDEGENVHVRFWEGLALTPVLLEVDVSSSKRFLPAIARDSFYCRWQAALLNLQNSLSGSSSSFVNLLTVLRVMMTDLQNI
ncbi:hypothetical protein Tco_0205474 [Tanacetum coccineum]